MHSRITVTLTDVPKYLRFEYHPDQVAFYSEFAKLMFKALLLPSVAEFMENLANALGLGKLNILVMRLPARRSRVEFVEKDGEIHLVLEELHGAAVRKRDVVLVWPDLIWPNKKVRPWGSVGIRGFILNSTIRAVIHEVLHKSGIKDENEVRRATEQHYKSFRRTYLTRFDEEFKPILKEWKRIEKEMRLR